MLRFAPSPTQDMHIGTLRVALFNYIVSKQRDEKLIITIEDSDREKNIEGKDQEILDILGLFGIEYSHVTYQSQNVRFHSAMALQLVHEKKAFSCFCSDDWLEKKRAESKKNNQPYRYDDACRDLPAELVIDNNNPFSIRVKDCDSFIILNHNKVPTYNFSCGVDDMLNDISLVIRGEEHLDNTHQQEHVRASLNYDKKIEYIHTPPIINESDFSVKSLLEDGFLPSAIANYLLLLGNETPTEIFTVEDSISWFKIESLLKSSSKFEIDMLKHINIEHLKMMDSKELSRYVGFADDEIGELAKLYLSMASTTKELKAKIAPIFDSKVMPDEFKDESQIVVKSIKSAPYFDSYDDFKNFIIEDSGIKSENFSRIFPILLTGVEDTPDIAEIYKYLKNYIGQVI